MPEQIQVTVEELRLRNYRAFENARLSLSDLTFLVGRNGAGKSSVLEAVELLSEAVTDNLEDALDRRGGLSKVRRVREERDAPGPLGVAVVLRLDLPAGRSTRAVYGFELYTSEDLEGRGDGSGHGGGYGSGRGDGSGFGDGCGNGYGSGRGDGSGHGDGSGSGDGRDPQRASGSPLPHVHECLRLHPEGSSYFDRDGDDFNAANETGVSPPPGNLVLPLIARSDSVWEAVYDAIRRMRVYDLSPSAREASTKIGRGTNLLKTGANAGDALKAIEGTKDHRWLVRHLAALTPGLSGVRTEALLGRRMLVFTQDQRDATHDYDASQVSQGTLRSLGVLLALRQQPTPSLVLVDEVENSVHPSALGVLLNAAEASKDRARIVFTTHSPEFLGHPSATGETGSVTYPADAVTPMTSDEKITMKSVLTLEQQTDLENQGGYFPDTQETQFDKAGPDALMVGYRIDAGIVGAGAAQLRSPLTTIIGNRLYGVNFYFVGHRSEFLLKGY